MYAGSGQTWSPWCSKSIKLNLSFVGDHDLNCCIKYNVIQLVNTLTQGITMNANIFRGRHWEAMCHILPSMLQKKTIPSAPFHFAPLS